MKLDFVPIEFWNPAECWIKFRAGFEASALYQISRDQVLPEHKLLISCEDQAHRTPMGDAELTMNPVNDTYFSNIDIFASFKPSILLHILSEEIS